MDKGKGGYKVDPARFWKFLIPSLIGVFIYIVPLPWKGAFSIVVGMMADTLEKTFSDVVPYFITTVICISALMALFTHLAKPKAILDNPYLNKLFNTTPFWLTFRCIGAVFAVMTLFKIGPEFIWHADTGGLMLHVLLQVLTFWFLAAGFFLPLLMDFGAMDYVGTLLRPAFRPLFTIPGRSAIDATASFIGSAPIGVVITNRQYVGGFYTLREAAVIATCFSIVSLPFNLVVAGFLGLMHVFPKWYLTVVIVTVVNAIILPRIYPLSKKPDTYHPVAGKRVEEEIPAGISMNEWALQNAMKRADEVESWVHIPREGIKIVLDVWFGVEPLVMAWGTIALVIAEFTPFFNWISTPFAYYLQLLQVPEAVAAAPAALVGFADMFLPAILIKGLPELTRFILGVLSITQLIYMTEVGAILLQSDMKISLWDLVVIFLERTIISLPLITLAAAILL